MSETRESTFLFWSFVHPPLSNMHPESLLRRFRSIFSVYQVNIWVYENQNKAESAIVISNA